MTPERLAEIKKICACIPFIDNGHGVEETQAAMRELIEEVSRCSTGAGGAALIQRERRRQIESEGWTPEHDDGHAAGELAAAAITYASPYSIRAKSLISGEYEADTWPWDEEHYKPEGGRVRNLVKAGALIAAEIDRLVRLEKR